MPLIDRLFDELLAQRGSDLHLGVGHPPLIRLRGELVALRGEPVSADEMESLLFELLSPEDLAKILADLDLDFAHAHGQKARFRASYFHKSTGLAAVFRAIPTRVLTLGELGCPELIQHIAERWSGLCLVIGPTGAGKSTTLAAMLDHINRTRACHILTLEAPIEFVHTPNKAQVTHREIGPDAPSFAAALRSAAREDADVILVGELRGNEALRRALELASAGLLVFATIAAGSAAAAIDHIVNAFPAEEQPQVRGMLAESLGAIIAQQLLETADGRGRVAAHEILLGGGALASMIREGKPVQIANLAESMDHSLERLVARGAITKEDALERAIDKEAFRKMLTRKANGG